MTQPVRYDSADVQHPVVRELAELGRYRDLIAQLVARNIAVRYKRSVLGFGWSLLSPLLTMGILSLVFTRIFQTTAPRYPVYVFPGLLCWGFFAQTTSIITAEVVGGVELWRRVYTPRTAFAVATTLTGLVHLAAALIPLVALMVVFGAPFTPALLVLPLITVCTALFALGVGLLVASVAGYFADAADLYQVVLQAWMYLSPVIYPRSILPESFQWLWLLNPMTLVIESFRQPFYEGRAPSTSHLVALALVSSATAAVGWWRFTRSANDLARRA